MDFRYQWNRMFADISQYQAPAVIIPSIGEIDCEAADYQERLSGPNTPYMGALCITGTPSVGKSTLARSLAGQRDIPIYDGNIAELTSVTRARVDDDDVHAFDTDIANLEQMFVTFYQGQWLHQEGIMVTGLERIAVSKLSLLKGAEFQTEVLNAFAQKHNLLNWQSDEEQSVLFWQQWFQGGLLNNYEYMNLLSDAQLGKWKQRLLENLIPPIQDHELHPIPLNVVITAPPGRIDSGIVSGFPERSDRARFIEVLPAMCAFYVYLTEMFPEHYFRVDAFDQEGNRKSEDVLCTEVVSILHANQWAGVDNLSP